MPEINCKDCGLLLRDEELPKCFKTGETLATMQREQCASFIALQYDGATPFTPDEHIFLFADDLAKKKMTGMQGLKFK